MCFKNLMEAGAKENQGSNNNNLEGLTISSATMASFEQTLRASRGLKDL